MAGIEAAGLASSLGSTGISTLVVMLADGREAVTVEGAGDVAV